MNQSRVHTTGNDTKTGEASRVSSHQSAKIARALLRLPLFSKIMVANLSIMVAVAALAALVATRIVSGSTGNAVVAIVLFAFVGGAVVVVANAFILRVALAPLADLEQAAARIRAGDLSVRLSVAPVADEAMERLIVTVNTMLDSIQEYQQRQRDVSRRALSAAEEERKRVAGDLHDRAAQTLAGLLVRLGLARSATDPEVRAGLLGEAADQAASAMAEIYRIVQALRPPAIEMLGLRGALQAYARATAEKARIIVDVDSDDLRGALDPHAEIALYRILQEALSNVVQHARASRAMIKLQRTMDGVLATVEDNGVGFAADQVERDPANLGLFGMRERTSYLGGRFQVRSGHRGTTVEIHIPLS